MFQTIIVGVDPNGTASADALALAGRLAAPDAGAGRRRRPDACA